SLEMALAGQCGTASRERSGGPGPHVHGPSPKIRLALERALQCRRVRRTRDRRHRLRHLRRWGHQLLGGGRQRVLVRRDDLPEFWARRGLSREAPDERLCWSALSPPHGAGRVDPRRHGRLDPRLATLIFLTPTLIR